MTKMYQPKPTKPGDTETAEATVETTGFQPHEQNGVAPALVANATSDAVELQSHEQNGSHPPQSSTGITVESGVIENEHNTTQTSQEQPGDTTTLVEPVKKVGRIASLDILRGIAILGTLASNIWIFSPMGGEGSFFTSFFSELPNGKFLSLLTIMFGIGIAIQYDSAQRRNARWPGYYPWRAFVLFLDGLIHYILVFQFDVLMGYAVTSFIVSYLLLTSTKVQYAVMFLTGGYHVVSQMAPLFTDYSLPTVNSFVAWVLGLFGVHDGGRAFLAGLIGKEAGPSMFEAAEELADELGPNATPEQIEAALDKFSKQLEGTAFQGGAAGEGANQAAAAAAEAANQGGAAAGEAANQGAVAAGEALNQGVGRVGEMAQQAAENFGPYGEAGLSEQGLGYWDQVISRYIDMYNGRSEVMMFLPMTIATFLSGILLYRAGLFEERGKTLRKWLMIIGLGVFGTIDMTSNIILSALPLDIISNVPFSFSEAWATGNWMTIAASVAQSVNSLGRYLIALGVAYGLLALIIEIVNRREAAGKQGSWIGSMFNYVGRIALTAYVGQNVFGMLFSNSWGIPLHKYVPLSGGYYVLFLFILIALIDILFAVLWLKILGFKQGPFEWVMKKAYLLLSDGSEWIRDNIFMRKKRALATSSAA